MVEKPTYEELRNRVEHLEQMISDHNGINTRHEESLSQLIQAMAIPTFIINEAHLVTHWNKACEKLTGVPSAEMVGTQDAWKAFYPEKRPVLADLVVDCSSHKQINEYYDHFSRYELVDDAFQAQAFFPRLGDTGKWLYFTATPLMDHSKKAIGAIETFQDITRPKLLEEHSRLILEAIPDSVVVYDIQHRITYINEAFEETYGWTKNDLIGGKIDFVPSEEIEDTKEAWQRTLNGEKVFFETKRKTKDGRLLEIQLRTAILKDKDGNHSASIVIHRDVTVIKQAELERERLIDELQQALAEVRTLSGLIPICASCKSIRDDKGYWKKIEAYLGDHSEAQFSHSICPDCVKKLYPDLEIHDDSKG